MDVQDLPIILKLEEDIDTCYFVPDYETDKIFQIKRQYTLTSDWIVKKPICEFMETDRKESISNKKYSQVIFRIKLKRNSRYYMNKIILPLVIISYLPIISCTTMKPIEHIGDRLQYLLAVLLSIIIFQMDISNKVPKIPYYTLIDIYISFTFIWTFIFIIITAISFKNKLYNIEKKIGLILYNIVWFIIHIIFIIICYYKQLYEDTKVNMTSEELLNIDNSNKKSLYIRSNRKLSIGEKVIFSDDISKIRKSISESNIKINDNEYSSDNSTYSISDIDFNEKNSNEIDVSINDSINSNKKRFINNNNKNTNKYESRIIRTPTLEILSGTNINDNYKLDDINLINI